MTLAGGDPRRLTLREFLDAAYALFVEEYQRLGNMTLFEATDRMSEWAAGGRSSDHHADDNPAPTDTQAALAQLSAMMKDVR